jgi:hypothetical protein
VFGGVHEQLILPIGFVSHADARLFLVRETLAKEISVASLLHGIVGLDCQELSNALADAVSSREVIEAGARITSLLFNPASRARRILVFEPAVWVRHGHTMQNLRDRLDRRKRRSRS